MATIEASAAERNLSFYQGFWEETPDFVRYNPGARHRRRMILQLLGAEPFESLLDVGCGNGELLALVGQSAEQGARRVPTLAGADLSPDQVERNRRRMPGAEFFALDVQVAPLPRTFDVVVCSEVVEHLEDARAAVANLARMVNPGGCLLVTCPAGTMYATERHFGHVRHPSAYDLAAWAESAGLRVDTLWNWGWPTYQLLKWATNVNADWALQNFANGPYSRGAKAVSTGLYWLNYLNRRDDRRGCQLVGVFRRPRST
jgi:2-polyprenyl-3-methyl-5-hydroxy-6-metoxy-1,4-benzoquinol methylase